MNFAELGLADPLLKAISDEGYDNPTPVQRKAIPPILLGRDVLAAAQTGTGKTASFTLPILQLLMGHSNSSASPARHPVRALVLTPTRELAAQVENSVKTYGRYVGLGSVAIYGGVPLDPQIKKMRSGIEIVVATPGRLLDLVQNKAISFNEINFFVLDEADRMLDMGFLPDINKIVQLLPKNRQTLLFSATYSEDIKKLAKQWLNDPIQIDAAPPNSAADTVHHTVYKINTQMKVQVLLSLIRDKILDQVLVFCNTKVGVNRLVRDLKKQKIDASALHSDRTQSDRTKVLDAFKLGEIGIVVATDIAARGLDIEHLPYVINFDVPMNPEDYVHRIGRTGRAGLTGEAITLVGDSEYELLGGIEELINQVLVEKKAPEIGGFSHKRTPKKENMFSKDIKGESSNQGDPLFRSPYVPTKESDKLIKKKACFSGARSKSAREEPTAALLMPRRTPSK